MDKVFWINPYSEISDKMNRDVLQNKLKIKNKQANVFYMNSMCDSCEIDVSKFCLCIRGKLS